MGASNRLYNHNNQRSMKAREKLVWAKIRMRDLAKAGKPFTCTQINREVYKAFGSGLYSVALYAARREVLAEVGQLPPTRYEPQRPMADEARYSAAVKAIINSMITGGIEKILVTPDGTGKFIVDAEVRTTATKAVKATFDAA